MSWYGFESRSAETPKRLNMVQSALWLKASAFHCGITMMALRACSPVCLSGGAGYQRAFTRSFSGYGVRTGEVKRRKSAFGSSPLAALAFSSAS